MYPILFQWEEHIVPSWHAFYAIGALSAYYILQRIGKMYSEFSAKELQILFVSTYVGGFFGARALSLILEEQIFAPLEILTLGPMTFYGGFIGGTFFFFPIILWRKLPLLRSIDLAAAPLFFGLTLGRIGCFLNGDDYGVPIIEMSFWPERWGVTFPNLADGIPRVPVQLLESALCFGIGVAITCQLRKSSKNDIAGLTGLAGVISYACGRFLLEFLRGDERGTLFTPSLSPAQVISIFLIILSAGIYYFLRQNISSIRFP